MLFASIVFGHLITGGTALVLKDGVGKLPALGWNSWNAYHCDITEAQFITAAEKFIELGLKDAGYEYVNIDDCWQIKTHRDANTSRLIPDPDRFPDGINGTAKKIHDMGLKIGIYSSAGTLTCAQYPASLGYESIDAKAWAEWGIDYLKYDNCFVPDNLQDECYFCVPEYRDDLVNGTCTTASTSNGACPEGYDYSQSITAKRFDTMRDAILAQNRTILYSLCEWGYANVQTWGNQTGSSWRMSGDIDPSWSRVLDLLNQNSFHLNHVDFWGHSDADMLEVGNGLSLPQSRTHFALWAAMKSPLLIGCDLAKVSQEEVDIMMNKYLLAFSQDEVYGKPAMPYKWGTNPDWTFNSSFPAEFWSGASTSGTLLLAFNPFEDTRHKVLEYSEIPQLGKGPYQVTDIWTGKDLGCVSDEIHAYVEGHDTAGFLVGEECAEGTKGAKLGVSRPYGQKPMKVSG